MWGVIIAEHRRGPHGTLERTETFERQGNERMKKKFTKRLLSWVMAAAMVISMLPISAMATETGGNVAKIGDTQYATLDDAVAAAADGATIELLGDGEITKAFNKELTFTGNGNISIELEQFTISKDLTFQGSGVSVEWTATEKTGWLMFCMNTCSFNVLDGAKVTFNFDSKATHTTSAIYANDGYQPIINVKNGSTLEFIGTNTSGVTGQAIQVGGSVGGVAATLDINVTGNSTFLIDGTNRGYVNSPTINVTDSTFTVQNCTANGSNGGKFTAVNSKITYQNNNGHGLSAGDLTIQNSTVTAIGNSNHGVTFTGKMTMDGTSSLIATENGSGGFGGGLRIGENKVKTASAVIESGAVLTLENNFRHGMQNFGTFEAKEGSKITITGNNMPATSGESDKDGCGGGVYNHEGGTIELPSNAVIYNNTAAYGGADIYNYDPNESDETVSTITFGKVGSDWVLDDCDHYIDGWYDDGKYDKAPVPGVRWEAHKEADADNHIKLIDNFGDGNLMTITNDQGLKAAHGKDPVDKTSYPGLDKQVSDANEPEWSDDDVDAAAGQDVNFKLISNVPDDLLNYIIPDVDEPEVVTPAAANALVPVKDRGEYHLTFHDMMNDMLVDATEPVVTLDRPDGQEDVTLTAGTQYVYTTETDDGCDFHIVIDLVALYDDGIITDDDIENATDIVVTYSAKLSGEAIAGTYENEAWTTVDENDWKSSPDTVYVNTYKLSIFKYDQAIGNKPEGGLGGAEFTLTKRDDETFGTKNLTSGPNGTVSLDGLDAGTYILTETKAPDGYVCNSDPQTIVIDEDHNTIAYVVTVNFANAPIPHTGGMGTTLFSIVGGALIATAGVIFVISRKKRAHSAA